MHFHRRITITELHSAIGICRYRAKNLVSLCNPQFWNDLMDFFFFNSYITFWHILAVQWRQDKAT